MPSYPNPSLLPPLYSLSYYYYHYDLLIPRKSWSLENGPAHGPMVAWATDTWCGVMLSSSTVSHADLYRNGENKLPKGAYVPTYAEPGNRESLRMVCFSSFEHACYEMYQRMLPVFHLALEMKGSGGDEGAGGGEGGGGSAMQQEEANIIADYAAGQREMDDADGEDGATTSGNEATNLEGYYHDDLRDEEIDGIDADYENNSPILGHTSRGDKDKIPSFSPPSSPRPPAKNGGNNASSSKSGSVTTTTTTTTTTTSTTEEEEESAPPKSPASDRKRKPGRFLMFAATGTINLENQTQQTIYYCTAAGLYESLALMKTTTVRGSQQMSQTEIARRDQKLRASLSFVTSDQLPDPAAAREAGLPCHLTTQRQNKCLLFPREHIYELVLEMEKDVLMVLLDSHNHIMCVLGTRLSIYVERELAKLQFPERFAALFEVALNLYQPTDRLTDERIENMYEVQDYPPLLMAEKLYRYYIGAAFNDFIKALSRDIKSDRDFKRNVAFRTAQLTKRAVDATNKELKKAKDALANTQ